MASKFETHSDELEKILNHPLTEAEMVLEKWCAAAVKKRGYRLVRNKQRDLDTEEFEYAVVDTKRGVFLMGEAQGYSLMAIGELLQDDQRSLKRAPRRRKGIVKKGVSRK